MATAAPSPNDLTRQQLDELDALLQRMLALPLNPPESFAPIRRDVQEPLPLPADAPLRVAATPGEPTTPSAEPPLELPPIQAPTMGVWSSRDFALTEKQMTN